MSCEEHDWEPNYCDRCDKYQGDTCVHCGEWSDGGDHKVSQTELWCTCTSDSHSDDPIDLGPCCTCGGREHVHTIITLPFRAPTPGTGWGCVVCDLPPDGAVAVVCDACDPATPTKACVGYPANGERIAISALHEPFAHDPARHPEEVNAAPYQLDLDGIRWYADSPPTGPTCLCSMCALPIDEKPIRMWREVGGSPMLEARFHPACDPKARR